VFKRWLILETKEESLVNIIRKYMDDLGKVVIVVEYIKAIIISIQSEEV
jgi:hypothetical protein